MSVHESGNSFPEEAYNLTIHKVVDFNAVTQAPLFDSIRIESANSFRF